MSHVYNFLSPSFRLDESNIGRYIIFGYFMYCEIPILRLCCRVFDMLIRM
jgi:hypothetical protein